MSFIKQSAEKAVTAMAPTQKVVDLQRDTVQGLQAEQPLTTDHGVKVSDTDNW
jgi:catalase